MKNKILWARNLLVFTKERTTDSSTYVQITASSFLGRGKFKAALLGHMERETTAELANMTGGGGGGRKGRR
jgi:hypothetical protein